MTAESGSQPARTRTALLARSGRLEYDRILFFSDAVFAIAITLLIVDLPVQVERGAHGGRGTVNAAAALHDALPSMLGFGISFAVIGLFWTGHHSLFRHIIAFDRPLMLLNLLFIGTIAFLPFPTALISAASTSQRDAIIFYSGCAGAAGLTEAAIWIYAVNARAGLVEELDPRLKRVVTLRVARVPVVFALSILIALPAPRLASYSWLLIWLSGVAISRRYGVQPLLGDTGEQSEWTGGEPEVPLSGPEDPPASQAGPGGGPG